jgi:phosphoglycolate phosphatase-like HAD superfamily hydrolase
VKRFVLWDVDGTLIHAGGAGREVFDVAVNEVLGRVVDHEVRLSGKTDPQIAREIMAAAAVPDDELERHLPAVLELIEKALAKEVERIRRDGRVLPGVGELLPRLHADPEVLQSVLTGNLEANALVKLGAFGLEQWIDLGSGAYGSDDHDRRRLVPVAIEKAKERHGVSFERHQVWVVGDTPRDFECAEAGGAHCLLVATGRIPMSELEGLGADAVLPDLSDVDQVLTLLGP